MKSGINYLTLLATDISGSPVNGLTSGWSIDGQIDGTPVNSVSISGAIGGDGFYIATVDLPVGQGYVTIDTSASGVFITPDYFDLEVTSRDIDELYGKFSTVGIANIPATSPSRFSVVSLNVKQDSDLIEVVQIPSIFLPLTGYSNMTVQCFTSAKLTNSETPPISGTYSATVLSEEDGTVEIHIGDDVLSNLIPQGFSSTIIYGDIKFFDADGNERRPVELNINVRRDFNNN